MATFPLLVVRLLQSLQKKQCIHLIVVTTTWEAASRVNLWYAVMFVTIRFEEILPASSWISSHNQKLRVTPEEPEELPSHLAGRYSGWSLALLHESCLKSQALKWDVITLENNSFPNTLCWVFKSITSLWELLRLSIYENHVSALTPKKSPKLNTHLTFWGR